MNVNLKKYIDQLLDIGPQVDHIIKTQLKVYDWNNNTKNIIKMELVKYLLYLSNSDGEISYYERDFIETYLDIYLSEEEAESLIMEFNLDKNNFANKQPISFII